MLTLMILAFVVGYLAIALEHVLKINKAAIALMMAGIIWTAYSFIDPISVLPKITAQMGDVCSIIFFLLGAMTIVELVDVHGGFAFVTHFIRAKSKKKLLWLITVITFFMSAVLDNMTTTIIMIAVMSKLIEDNRDRLWFASLIVVAANGGGAWSPIGDVTTIMLWVKGNVTSLGIIKHLFLASMVSVLIPAFLISLKLKGTIVHPNSPDALEIGEKLYPYVTRTDKVIITAIGVGGLVCVPLFKTLTGLPPFMGVTIVLALLWFITEVIYSKRRDLKEGCKLRISKVIHYIDSPTIFFFFGILLAVSALQEGGLLTAMSDYLNKTFNDVYLITGIIGVLSSVIDNVPLVAAAMGMYPLADASTLQAGAYMLNFVQNGTFWELLAYCAGVGGSLLIIGSAAGVVAMGAEHISFVWYLKHITPRVFIGYIAGILVYMLMYM
jgi:Na+/H+ antiporter NhaD/arsenite permease-like protein